MQNYQNQSENAIEGKYLNYYYLFVLSVSRSLLHRVCQSQKDFLNLMSEINCVKFDYKFYVIIGF